jgi:hypothetical protein
VVSDSSSAITGIEHQPNCAPEGRQIIPPAFNNTAPPPDLQNDPLQTTSRGAKLLQIWQLSAIAFCTGTFLFRIRKI